MKNLPKTDINRFIEAQEVPYFCGYKQALEEVKNGTSEFKGEWIEFGSEKFPDWNSVLVYLM